MTVGEPPEFADATSVPDRPPAPIGENVTDTEQLPLTASVSGQLVVNGKSLGFAPATEIASAVVMPTGPVPVFDTMNVWGVLLPVTTVLGKLTGDDGEMASTPGHPVFGPA
jgi:hypothetical protein